MRIDSISVFVIVLVALVAISCKSKNITTEPQTSKESNTAKVIKVEEPESVSINRVIEENQVKSTTPELYSLVVSFYSIGAGIDAPIAQEFDYYVRDFQEQHADYFYAERVPWGREGEIDYCIQYPTLNKEKAQEFIRKTNEIISKSKMVHMTENGECKRRRKTN
jgi:hypothetical protein